MHLFRYCPDCGARLDPAGLPSERVISQTCPACGAVHGREVLDAWHSSARQPGWQQASWMPRERWQALVAGEDCPLCDELAGPDRPNTDGFPVADLGVSRLRLSTNQVAPGYCLLICRRHVREPFELPPQEQVQYWHDLMRAAQAIQAAFEPIKLNLQMLGNLVPHLHTHLTPRYYGDSAPGRPFGPGDPVTLVTPEAAAGLVQRLIAALASDP